MRNMTTMLLVTLLLASLLAGIPTNELDTEDTVDQTSARSGADVDILGITQPSETTCTAAGCRDELLVGESTTFEVVMKNIGTGDVEDMSYSLDIYLTDSTKTRGLQALDSSGQPLSWTNDVAVCDEAASCDETSFAANTIYTGGAATLTSGGADITWSPSVGEYLVVISVDSDQDTDPANDEEEIYVVVRDYTDIEVDLCWTDGAGVCEEGDRAVGTGTESRQFLLTVTAEGSQDFNPREVNVSVELDGFDAASGGGFDLGVDGEEWLVVAGNAQTVEVYRNTTTDTGTDASRSVLAFQTAWTMTGTVTPGDGGYSIDARVVDHTMYGQDPACAESWIDDPAAEPPVELTSDNWCEYLETNDDYSRTDSDDIYGFSALFHDIRLQTLSVAQGYSADGSGEPTSVIQDGMDLDLRVGTTLLHATVGHFGSDVSKMVDWNVVFTVTSPDGTEATYNADECPTGLAPAYTHKFLGTHNGQGTPQEADIFGSACVMLNNENALTVGEYNFEADLNFLGVWDTTAERLDTAITDEKASNNRKVMNLDVVNNQPSVLSMTMFNTGDLVVSQEAPLEFDVLAFDVDCVAGDCLTYTWAVEVGGVDNDLGMCGGVGAVGAQCTFQILPEYMPAPRVKVTVTDDNGASTSEYMDLTIWNDVTAESTTADSGITVAYALQYSSTTPYTITATDASAGVTGMELPGYSGQYDSVAVIDFAPDAQLGSLAASGVLSQSMTFTVPKSLLNGEGSIWFNQGSMYQLIDNTAEDSTVDPTMSVFTWDLPANEDTLSAGKFVLFGGALDLAEAPTVGITAFSAAAGKGGTLIVNWGIDASETMSLGDIFLLEICDVAGDADCMNSFVEAFESDVKTYTRPGTFTTHGTVYTISVKVCTAERLCNDQQVGLGNVTADSEVDGDGAMSITSITAPANGDSFTVVWTSVGDDSDVANWRICYGTDKANIRTSGDKCTTVGLTQNTVEIAQPTFTGTETYHFVGVAVDDLGNSKLANEGDASAQYRRDADFTNTDDGNGTVGEDVSGESELPGWTLPAIGGVVVAAIVVGAIIVTRGGGGGDDKDWDY